MRDTLLLSVAAVLLTDRLAAVTYSRSTTTALGRLTYGLVCAAVVMPQVFGRWNTPFPWVLAMSFAVVEFMATGFRQPFARFLFRHLTLVVIVIAVSASDPSAAQGGLWQQFVQARRWSAPTWTAIAILNGVLLCVFTGGALVSAVIKQLMTDEEILQMQGLPHGGRIIGWLERSIVMLLIWMDQPEGIGFLVAAKSILRFDDIHRDHQRKTTEYVIIGTFLSFGWAMLVSVVLRKIL